MNAEIIRALESVGPETIRKIAEMLAYRVELAGRIFLAGNGGSHSIGQHLASDLMKAVGDAPAHKGCQAIPLGSNTALLTALSNDLGYDYSLSNEAMYQNIDCNDVLIAFSVSGRSNNLKELFRLADRLSTTAIMISGKPLPQGKEHPCWIISDWQYCTVVTGLDEHSPMHYYVCESVFSCIAHAIVNQFHILRGNYNAET